jgi:hypothetical protein
MTSCIVTTDSRAKEPSTTKKPRKRPRNSPFRSLRNSSPAHTTFPTSKQSYNHGLLTRHGQTHNGLSAPGKRVNATKFGGGGVHNFEELLVEDAIKVHIEIKA